MADNSQNDKTLQRLRWAANAYSRSMAALLHTRDFSRFASEVCESIVNEVYCLAWIGLADPGPGKPVRVLGVAGSAARYCEGLDLSWDENAIAGQGATGRALRSGKTQIVRSASEDPKFLPWRERAREYNIQSTVTVPCRIDDRHAGAMMVYANEVDAFGPDEISLFEQLAGEVLYALVADKKNRLLRSTEAKFSNLIAATPTPIIGVDTHSIIQIFNQAAERSFGYTRDEVIGRPLDMLIPNRWRPNHSTHVELFSASAAQSRKMSAIREVFGRKKTGDEFPIEVIISRLQTEDGLLLTGIIRDLTDEKRLQERVIHAQKMDAFGQLAGGISHDFNNLLGVIVANMEILRDGAMILPAGEKHLRAIQNSCGRAADLTKRLLVFARKSEAHRQDISVRSAIKEICEMIERTFNKNVQISTSIMGDPHIFADPDQFHTALLNLAVNARDAMPNGGEISFVTSVEDHGTGAGNVVMTVSDTGCGMTPDILAKIFEPYFTTKPEGSGTGLGLPMVYGFVKASGGSIEVNSRPSKGTEVVIKLPRHQPEFSAPANAPGDISRLEGIRILQVEDNEDLRDALSIGLMRLGAEVISVSSPDDAIQIVTGGSRFNVLVSDRQLGAKMDGIQLAERLCQIQPDLCVIITTGFLDPAIKKSIGATWTILQKPISTQMLCNALRTTRVVS